LSDSEITVTAAQFARKIKEEHPRYALADEGVLDFVERFIHENPQYRPQYRVRDDGSTLVSVSWDSPEPAQAPSTRQPAGAAVGIIDALHRPGTIIALVCAVAILAALGFEQYKRQQGINSEAAQYYQRGIDLQAAGKLSDAQLSFNKVVQQFPASSSVTPATLKLKEVKDEIEVAQEKERSITGNWAKANLNGLSSNSDGLVTRTDMSGVDSNRSHSHDTVTAQMLDSCKVELTLNSSTHRQRTGEPDSDESRTSVCNIDFSGLPDSSVSFQRVGFNDEQQYDGWSSKIVSTANWAVFISDAQRVRCTGDNSRPTNFTIQFENQVAARKTAESIKAFVHQHCAQ
jgi:hypothetical protein